MANKKILIVEDDKMIRSMYETKLKQEGFFVLLAENGTQGLEIAIKEKPDLILLDIIMPQIDGFTVLQELRLHKALKKTPIILLTNLGTSEDKEKGHKFGADDYLVKSNLTPAQITDIVRKYLKIKKK